MGKRVVFSTSFVEKVTNKMEDGFMPSNLENPYYDKKIGLRKAKLPFRLTDEELSEYTKCKLDVKYFANNHCKVKVEDGTYDIISLRDYQYDIVDMFQNPSNKFNILLSSRQIGKTIISAIYILHYMLFNNDKNVLIAANKGQTAIDILDKIKDIYVALPFFLQKGIDVWNQKTIRFDNNSKAKAFTMTATSSIGNTGDLVYLDEFAYIPDTIAQKFYKSIQPTLVSIEDSKMIITSTPNGLNLFHKLVTDAEREQGDPLKNNFASMRVYWYQVPGRNVTYIRCNQFKMVNNHIDFDTIYKTVKDKYDPNDSFDENGLPYVKWKENGESGEKEIHIQNREDVTLDDVSKLKFRNRDGNELPIGSIGELSSWKLDAIKNIGGEEAFNQEYDLRFVNASKSLFAEETLERIKKRQRKFEFKPHQVFEKLTWDYSNLKFIDDESIYNEASRKKIKGVISVDVSEGLGQDYSVINIFKIDKKPFDLIDKQKSKYQSFVDFFCLKQIGVFRSNVVSVSQLAEMLYLLAFEYFDEDNFKIVLEINNHGHAVLEAIKNVFNQDNNYGSHIFFRFKHRKDSTDKKIGLKVSGNKKLLVRNYQDRVKDQDIVVYEKNTISEMTTFIKNESRTGNITYEADGSCKDDMVMTIVDLTAIYEDNIFNDMVDEFKRELNDFQLEKYIDDVLKDSVNKSGTDYGSFLNSKRRAVNNNKNWIEVKNSSGTYFPRGSSF